LGIGDDIMLTAKLKRIKSENPDKSVVPVNSKQIRWSAIYENNPNISNKITKNTILVQIRPRPYTNGFIRNEKGSYSQLKPHKPKPGEIYFTDIEIKKAKNTLVNISNFIYIEPNIRKNCVYGTNKDWGFNKWQAVVDSFPDLTFVQATEHPSNKKLQNVTNIETPNLRDALAILSLSSFFVGGEGGMHHASAALGKRAVVIFGGVSSPNSTGYDNHISLYIEHPESPCGRTYKCDHCLECMDKITVQDVIDSINSL